MSRFESLVEAESWRRLVRDLLEARDDDLREGEPLDDGEIAEIVRHLVYQVEGEEV
jgi:hypothetical protein